MSGPFSCWYQWVLASLLSKTYYNRTPYFITAPLCPSSTLLHCWSFTSKIVISSAKVSILDRSMVQPLVAPLMPSLPTCSLESLNPRPSALSPNPSRLWLRYVDDTYVIQEAEQSQQLLQHINSIDPHIQFTMENPKDNDTLPFLETVVFLGAKNTITTTVYRKPTNADQYLH